MLSSFLGRQFYRSTIYIYIYIYLYIYMRACVRTQNNKNLVGGPRSVIPNALDCDIAVSEFELHSRYNVPFQTNSIEKGMNPLIPPVVVLMVLLLFYEDHFVIE